MKIEFTVYGNPKGLKRHRTFRLKTGQTVQVDASKADKENFLTIAMEHRPDKPLSEPIDLTVEAYYQRPKSHYGTGKKSQELKNTAPEFFTGTPDADNVLKFIGDALSGVFWVDDRYISSATIRRFYSDRPQVEVRIETYA